MSLGHIAHRIQDRILASFGRSPADRSVVVRAMLQPRNGDAAGYWLQLVIATMLATLGLALNSTAVVIGAMLIAPLMRPLVELAMGFATGSAGLVLRATIRTVVSIGVATLVAFAITWLLPFHEITPELEARTAPSLLDLAVAATCALAAAYASLRADADIATTAAGTSIGISLVPPLCATGYGLALGDEAVTRGAALLFAANISGILVIATMVFAVAGFSQVDVGSEETALDESGARFGRSIRVGRAWSRLASTRLGPLARIVPPLILLVIVYVPLQRAVGEIRRRNEIQEGVARLLDGDKSRVVQYTLDQTASAVRLRVVVVGDARTASELDQELHTLLAKLDVRDPKLNVWAVPDAASVSALSTRLDAIPPPLVKESIPRTARRHISEIVVAIRAAWPKSGTGELVGIWHDLEHPLRVRVIHLGAPIGAAGVQLLAQAVVVDQLELEEDALLPIEAAADDGQLWLPLALDLIARARLAPGVQLCLTLPEDRPAVGKKPGPGAAKARLVRDAIMLVLSDTMVAAVGASWSIVPQRGPCATITSLTQP